MVKLYALHKPPKFRLNPQKLNFKSHLNQVKNTILKIKEVTVLNMGKCLRHIYLAYFGVKCIHKIFYIENGIIWLYYNVKFENLQTLICLKYAKS